MPTSVPKRLEHPLDEAITSQLVNYVDANDQLHLKRSLPQMLSRIDRQTQHIRQVAVHVETGLPIVKIASRRDMQREMQMKLAYKRAQRAPEAARKELELTWGIDQENDLRHRLGKMVEFLEEGRAVDVLIAKKKGAKRKVSDEESAELVVKIKDTALGVSGVKEARAMEGQVGKQILLHFRVEKGQRATAAAADDENDDPDAEVPKSKAAAMVKDREDKKAEKERKKAEWKTELEDRARRKAEREGEVKAQRSAQASV